MRSTKCGPPRQDLADARARAANAHAAIAPGEQPSIAQAQAAVDKARLDLSRTEVRAPMDGVIENADNLQVGQMAVTGVGMLSLVHSSTAWVEANFKEKDVGRMVPGQKANDRGRRLSAARNSTRHVQSIGAGTGSEFSLLPAQNANGNWVKVTQRVPVRIAFDGKPSQADDCRPVGRPPPSISTTRRSNRRWPTRPAVATHPLPTGERLIVTIGVMMAVLLQVLDTTIANVALPHMQASLSATQDTINWVLTSYIVASAIALPISGWLADKVGRKRLLLISVVVFTVASVLCATATSLDRDGACSARSRASAAPSSSRSPRRPCSTSTRAKSTARRWRCSAAA